MLQKMLAYCLYSMKPIGRTFGQLPNIFLANDKMGKSSGLRRVVSSGKYLSTYGEHGKKHVAGTSRVGCPFTRSNTQAGIRGVPAKDVGWFIPPRGFESHLLRHPIIPLVKPCSSTALWSYSSAYPSRLGSLIPE